METNDIKVAVQDSHIRPIIKAVSWRIIAMIITGAVVYVYTGEIKKSGEISVVAGLIFNFSSFFHQQFFFYECRFWRRVFSESQVLIFRLYESYEIGL